MTGPELDRLIVKAKAGELSIIEQQQLAEELTFYRDAAHRLERSVHRLVKEAES